MLKRLKLFLKTRFYAILFLTLVTGIGCDRGVGVVAVEPGATVSGGTGGQIAQITDVHFNPFYDATLFDKLKSAPVERWEAIFLSSQVTGVGTYEDFSEETDFPLLASSLGNMAAMVKHPDFIVFTGDFLAHDFHNRYKKVNNDSLDGFEDFVDKTVTFFVLMFNKYFPAVPVYVSLGNNDSYAGDYKLVPEGDFLENTAPLFADKLLRTGQNRQSFYRTYPGGGYYTVAPAKSEGTRIIALNTIFFSSEYETDFDEYDPAEKELAWLQEQLEAVRQNKEKAWLLLHIPPGYNAYGILKDKIEPSWKPAYCDTFIELLRRYADVVTASFAGHTHMDDFRLLLDDGIGGSGQAVAFVHICPAVSSLFGNNPGFERLTYNRRSFLLTDYRVYYLDLLKIPVEGMIAPRWSMEYDFGATYRQARLTPATHLAVYAAIEKDPTIRGFYGGYYDVSHQKAVTDDNWRAYWCAVANWTEGQINDCYNK